MTDYGTFTDYTCMECGEDCEINEVVDTGYGGPYELWCYCPQCDCETFHPSETERRL
jgi:hypothetical protein